VPRADLEYSPAFERHAHDAMTRGKGVLGLQQRDGHDGVVILAVHEIADVQRCAARALE
jgi:hypothetical protein